MKEEARDTEFVSNKTHKPSHEAKEVQELHQLFFFFNRFIFLILYD